jgi:RNA polymerase sigma factor (sigma-70 family)
MRDDPRVVALVTRAAGGDQDAWCELVDRYAPLVYTICTRYRLSNHDTEDVMQSVWLLLVEQLGKLREPAALPGWIATTTARECLRVVTAASKAEDVWARAALEFSIPEDQEPETQAVADCEARLAVEMLRALPRRQRETITLAFEGYTTTEIASLLGTDRNAVRVNLHHARAKLITRLHEAANIQPIHAW